VHPAASAGPHFRVIIAAGKFHGVIATQTPLFQNQDAAVGGGRGDVMAVDALSFLGEPFDEGSGVADFALGLGQRLALLGRHDPRQVLDVREDQLVPALQYFGAFGGRAAAPRA
jgi:hypothetical protein